jgi:hypothetical protein
MSSAYILSTGRLMPTGPKGASAARRRDLSK